MEDVGIFYGHLVYFTAFWYILPAFGIFCCHLVYFMVIWYIFHCFGMLYKEKSCNSAIKNRQYKIKILTVLSRTTFVILRFHPSNYLSSPATRPSSTTCCSLGSPATRTPPPSTWTRPSIWLATPENSRRVHV
jgi:hypothetical protein